MKAYLDIVKNVLANGVEKFPVRMKNGVAEPVDGGVKTIMVPNQFFSHHMEDGFPLLTTKKMAVKAILVELEGFIKGITDKKWFQERGCRIWNEWANPMVVDRESKNPMNSWAFDNRKELQAGIDDLGPIYGYQWRSFNKHYQGQACDQGDSVDFQDQLKNILTTLKTNYNDRRMVCSAWNPNQLHMMALPPCHLMWVVTVSGDRLNLHWTQRSCDLMLGVPFNVASYAMLLTLLSMHAGLKPGNLSGTLIDCHIYENQIDAASVQLGREPRKLPKVIVNSPDVPFDMLNWTHDQTSFEDYNPHPRIDFGEVTV